MKKKWKTLTAVCCAAALTLSLTACSGKSGDSEPAAAGGSATGEAAAAETTQSSGRTDLNIRIGDAFSTVDPHNLSLNSDMMLSRQIYEPLYWLNDSAEEVPCSQRNIP